MPGVAAAVVATLSTLEAPAATGFVANVYVTPLIAGVAESETLPVKPLRALLAIVYEVDAPAVIVLVAGVAESEKSGVGALAEPLYLY